VDAQGLSRALADGPASCPSLTTLSLPANLIDDDMVGVKIKIKNTNTLFSRRLVLIFFA